MISEILLTALQQTRKELTDPDAQVRYTKTMQRRIEKFLTELKSVENSARWEEFRALGKASRTGNNRERIPEA